MNLFSCHLLRTIIFVGVIAVSVSACGRRGALEAPPDPNAVIAQKSAKKDQPTSKAQSVDNKDDDDDSDNDLSAPVGQAKKRPKGFVIPKDPFILDPLL